MRDYEATIVLTGSLDDEGVNKIVSDLGELIARKGGTVTLSGQLADKRGNVAETTEGWRPRKLSYAIKGQREGYYLVLRFQAPPEAPDEMERWLKLSEPVLRFLVLRTDED